MVRIIAHPARPAGPVGTAALRQRASLPRAPIAAEAAPTQRQAALFAEEAYVMWGIV